MNADVVETLMAAAEGVCTGQARREVRDRVGMATAIRADGVLAWMEKNGTMVLSVVVSIYTMYTLAQL